MLVRKQKSVRFRHGCHRQVAFFVTVIPSRQNRSANNELIFCEKPYLSY
ncbi:hypothetical protein G7B21_17345 [Klebsiella pneumoniae]|nr:hypothetical protein [Klebsiella pneumoniae]NGQ25978.1 hypothetical protein [Klebsiella pneumoniae]